MHVFKTSLILLAASALPATAWLPLEARSNTEVDLGNLQSMESFFQAMGFNGNTTWEEITEYETHDLSAIAEEDAELGLALASSVATRQDEGYCGETTGFTAILCNNMPSREAWWATGGALLVWYLPDVLTKWCDAIAHIIITARSLRQMRDGNTLNVKMVKRGEANTNYKFTIPMKIDGVLGNRSSEDENEQPDLELSNTYIFDANTQIIHYHSTNSIYRGVHPDAVARRAIAKRTTSDYSIVIQATALSSASTIADEWCVSDMVKYHINYASEHNRFKCVPVDNRGSWKMALHVNINHGTGNEGEKGECCDFY